MLALLHERSLAFNVFIALAGWAGLHVLLYCLMDLLFRLFPPSPEPSPSPEPPEMPDAPEPEPEASEIFERSPEKPAQPEKSFWDNHVAVALGCVFIPGFAFVALGVHIFRRLTAEAQEEDAWEKGRPLLTPEQAVARAIAIEQELARTERNPKV
jgi:hypothetical protein